MNVLLGYLLAINLVTGILMLYDKLQASFHSRRVRERTLYILTLLGGSPAMLLAMYTIRHKSRKLSFQLTVWFLFLIQLTFVVWFLTEKSPLWGLR